MLKIFQVLCVSIAIWSMWADKYDHATAFLLLAIVYQNEDRHGKKET